MAFRDIANPVNERTLISSAVLCHWPCGDKLPVFHLETPDEETVYGVVGLYCSLCIDYVVRLVANGKASLMLMKLLPCPLRLDETRVAEIVRSSARLGNRLTAEPDNPGRAMIDAIIAEVFELSPAEYVYILSTFPLLDRDQPPLPGDHRVRATNKGIERRRQSFITRDLALLTYFDYLADRLDVKPDIARVSRICPDGVPEPPTDIVAFFAESGVDISGVTDRAVAKTGPIRNLRERVCLARELGAVAYVPTIDRRRASSSSAPPRLEGSPPTKASLLPRCPGASFATRRSAPPGGSGPWRHGKILFPRQNLARTHSGRLRPKA